MVNKILVISVLGTLCLSFRINCFGNSSFLLDLGQTYTLSLMNSPGTPYMIIGKIDEVPSMSYSSSPTEVNFSADFYSLVQLASNRNYILVSALSQPRTAFFSVCLLDSDLEFDPIFSVNPKNDLCLNDCSYLGECLLDRCICTENYFGEDCSLQLIDTPANLNRTDYTIEIYSILFLKVNKGINFYIENIDENLLIFKSNTSIPSFFSYQSFEIGSQNLIKKVSDSYLTFFCASPYPCKIEAFLKTTPKQASNNIIVIICSSVGSLSVCILGLICYKYKILNLCNHNNHQNVRKKDLNIYLPIQKWKGKCGHNICAICLNEYQAEDELRKIKICRHHFHLECIEEWLKIKSICPICKCEVNKKLDR